MARMGDRRATYRVLVGHLGKRDHLEDLDVGWRKILKWMFKKWDGEARTRLFWLRLDRDGGRL